MRGLLKASLAAAVLALGAPMAAAGPGQDLLVRHLEAGTLAQGAPELATLSAARPRDQEALYALGLAQYARAFERLNQGLYRHGLRAPGPARQLATGIVLLNNPTPEPVDYQKLRALFATFVTDLDAAAATLARVDSTQVKVRLDLARIRLDINGDGRGGEDEVVARLFAPAAAALPGLEESADPPPAEGEPFVIAFDRADALWLRGYANLIAAPIDFALAHDFEAAFNGSFHALFPDSGLPMSRHAPRAGRTPVGDVDTSALFADGLALVHLAKGPVVEPERRARVRQRLLQVVALSRQNLAALAQERDNDRELLPNPRQTAAAGGARVTQAQLDAWRGVLTEAEAVLQGRTLVPHWRFAQGVDMKAFFDEGRAFDLVGVLTGHDLTPYLRAGPQLSTERAQEITRALGPDGFGLALWFN